MKYPPSPVGRRFSLPAFDIFGQPMFEPYLYYTQFHPYPPPPPPPPPPPHPPHHGYQYLPEPYPYFNIPETFQEEYFIPSSPDTNPLPNSPPNRYPISRETNPDIANYNSSISSSSSPNSFSFAVSVPPFDVSRTETPGECHYRLGLDEMVVRTIPHPDTIQEKYDGPNMRRKKSISRTVTKNQQPQQQQTNLGRALVVNGSTNDPIPPKAPKKVQVPAAVSENKENTQAKLPPKPEVQPTNPVTTAQVNKPSVEQAKPDTTEHEGIKIIPFDESESACVHITLNHLPHSNKLNAIRLRANYTATANKPKLIEEARSIFTAALQSHKATEGVQLGSWFSWTERGVNVNFKTKSQRWVAAENPEWLSEIGDGIRLNEKWGGIVIRDIWNPYILENAVPDDNLKRKLEQLNIMSYNVSENETVQEPYRIRKVRWFGPSTLAVWFHDTTVADYFAQKGVWLMEGYVGVGKQKKVGVCGLPTVYPLVEQRNRIGPHNHVKKQNFISSPATRKEGHGGQHGRNGGEPKGSKPGWHQKN